MPSRERRAHGLRPILPIVATLALLAATAPAQPAPPAPAGSGLLVAPTRLVFEGRERSAELTLINRSPESATYRVLFRQMSMDEDGALREIPDAHESSAADSLVRYAPRQVTLGPGETQTVRLQLRLPAELQPGEYRSHLELRYVPPAAAAPAAVPAARSSGGFGIRLVPLYGVAVPVIVRHGATAAEVRIEGVELAAGEGEAGGELRLVLRRTGSRSVFGHLEISFRRGGMAPETLAQVRGVAVYVPNTHRRVRIPIDMPLSSLSGGILEIGYRDAEGTGGRLAGTTVRVP